MVFGDLGVGLARGTAPSGNQEGAKWGDKGSGISRFWGAAKLQSGPGADNQSRPL